MHKKTYGFLLVKWASFRMSSNLCAVRMKS
jgi:hypothetical protein